MTDIFAIYEFDDILRVAVSLIILFSGIIAILFSVWGGFLLVVSGGKEDKVKAAVNHIRYAALGIVILVLLIFIIPLFLRFFGFPQYAEFFSPGVLFSNVRDVAYNLFGGGVNHGDLLDDSKNTIPSDFTNL